jgi:plasmid stabilization system protein ParE
MSERGPLDVVLQRRALREIEEIDAWWRENRLAAPGGLFVEELAVTLSVVALMPTLGARLRGSRASGLRRVLLRRTQHHAYYRVRGEKLVVLAVWHAARGTVPQL